MLYHGIRSKTRSFSLRYSFIDLKRPPQNCVYAPIKLLAVKVNQAARKFSGTKKTSYAAAFVRLIF
ncbi:hypothetical protein C7H79_03825 [Nitrosomonas supralitoralis]|uniref:Uncharacterized protein n=1 Tax=Nitrosomonas supralitoralis TaxID=2116706 RepID=A0A2P7NXY2_9PROT|nr:hypothetical protein C7H79_03825 [Nitrosomonas supralitoralis]